MDDSGEAITFVFLGRRSIAGLRSGTQMVAEGMVGKHKGKLAMINPSYEVLFSGTGEEGTVTGVLVNRRWRVRALFRRPALQWTVAVVARYRRRPPPRSRPQPP